MDKIFLMNQRMRFVTVVSSFILTVSLVFCLSAQEKNLPLPNADQPPSMGTGNIKVRLYADYYCSPCRAFEPKAEPVIADLVKRNIVTITFIDTPFHKYSSLYTRYFLYIFHEKKDPAYLFRARNVLFEASKENVKKSIYSITDPKKLEEHLGKNDIHFKPYDVTPVFTALEGYLEEDKIMETPSCVIINGDKKEFYKGGANILKALSSLK
ncbi:MAG: DsbA family protein [Syntrophobacterales bacterium]|nr:DsbA family protein [Syntrophobacterales bacterium]